MDVPLDELVHSDHQGMAHRGRAPAGAPDRTGRRRGPGASRRGSRRRRRRSGRNPGLAHEGAACKRRLALASEIAGVPRRPSTGIGVAGLYRVTCHSYRLTSGLSILAGHPRITYSRYRSIHRLRPSLILSGEMQYENYYELDVSTLMRPVTVVAVWYLTFRLVNCYLLAYRRCVGDDRSARSATAPA